MGSDAAATVRVFNRFYTRLAGVLADEHLGLGLPLGQVRVLFEVGQLEPVEARALQAHLGLDAGYLSKRVAELETTGLIRRAADRADARRKSITLTAKGRRKLAEIDRKSDLAAEQLVRGLDSKARDRVVGAMLELMQLLDEPVSIAPEPATSAEARACLHAYYSELQRLFPTGFDVAASVSATPDEVSPPRGEFLLVRAGGRPKGCGAVKTLGPGVGEIKRMWLHPELRGRGVGQRLLAQLEASGRALGHHTLRLDTSSHLPAAIKLYRRSGYREVPAYNDNPYAAHWFEKTLEPR